MATTPDFKRVYSSKSNNNSSSKEGQQLKRLKESLFERLQLHVLPFFSFRVTRACLVVEAVIDKGFKRPPFSCFCISLQ